MADSDLQIRRRPGHPDPEIRGGGGGGSPVSKIFFRPFQASVWSKNKGGGHLLRAPPLDPPLLVAEDLLVYSLLFSKSEILNSALPLLAERQRRSFLGSLVVFSYNQVHEPVE